MNLKQNKKITVELEISYDLDDNPFFILSYCDEDKKISFKSYNEDFYQELEKVIRLSKNNLINCSNQTKLLLDKGITYFVDNYYSNNINLKEKIEMYRYEHFMEIEKETEKIRSDAVYDWSVINNKLFKGDENLKFYIYRLSSKYQEKFHCLLKVDNYDKKIIINTRLKSAYYIYCVVNSYITVLKSKLFSRNKTFFFGFANKVKPSYVEKEDYIEIISDDFPPLVKEYGRHLTLPYADMIKLISNKKYNSNIFELLDYIERKTNYQYPREEIKKHILDCMFVKEYEEKNKKGVKRYGKSLF